MKTLSRIPAALFVLAVFSGIVAAVAPLGLALTTACLVAIAVSEARV